MDAVKTIPHWLAPPSAHPAKRELDSEHRPLAPPPGGNQAPPSLGAIPGDVAQSMAFEGEPVPEEAIRAILARIEPRGRLKPHMASSAARSWHYNPVRVAASGRPRRGRIPSAMLPEVSMQAGGE